MVHSIKIELIGDGTPRRRPAGVWELTGLSPGEGGFLKRVLSPHKDYSKANSVGSRGVFAFYLLEEGKIYEVMSPQSWGNTNHYYVTYGQGQEWRLEIGQVFQTLASMALA